MGLNVFLTPSGQEPKGTDCIINSSADTKVTFVVWISDPEISLVYLPGGYACPEVSLGFLPEGNEGRKVSQDERQEMPLDRRLLVDFHLHTGQ